MPCPLIRLCVQAGVSQRFTLILDRDSVGVLFSLLFEQLVKASCFFAGLTRAVPLLDNPPPLRVAQYLQVSDESAGVFRGVLY